MPSKKQLLRTEKLAKRTVQTIGFGFAVFLTITKLVRVEADIPWWVIFGFFGFGFSGDGELIKLILGRNK